MNNPKFTIDENRIFRVAVVATVSSGKSTVINALVGRELLPSINQACTARTLAVLDNDHRRIPLAHIYYQDMSVEEVDNCSVSLIRKFNDNAGKPIADIVVECDISGIHNAQTALLIVDTPGINNHLNAEHDAATKAYLEQMSQGLILFVFNACQLTTEDTQAFLQYIRRLTREHPALQTLFVVNRIDDVDRSREPLESIMETAAAFVEHCGFERPTIIATSAKAALLFKSAMAQHTLSESDMDDFPRFYRRFAGTPDSRGYDCRSLIWDAEFRLCPDIKIDGETYEAFHLKEAIDRTGIPLLEQYIEGAMLRAANADVPEIECLSAAGADSGAVDFDETFDQSNYTEIYLRNKGWTGHSGKGYWQL